MWARRALEHVARSSVTGVKNKNASNKLWPIREFYVWSSFVKTSNYSARWQQSTWFDHVAWLHADMASLGHAAHAARLSDAWDAYCAADYASGHPYTLRPLADGER